SLAILGYFKYADFFIDNFAGLTGLSIPLLNIALPIGISFYTFQILSYTVDVYRGDVAAQKSPITLGAYIAMFPQLIAGPIVRYRDVEIQLNTRTHSIQKAASGIKRFMIGLCKKILIANLLGEITAVFLASADLSVLFYWLNAVAFSLQIYFDFSGYSDMAIGLGRIFGFEFLENFNYPYISKSITEFWRRWHMSLGQWFRDYVYIPMGGNRVSKARHFINILVVWMLTGFWHGASWNFVLWGLYFALLLMLEKYLLLDKLKKSKVLSRIFVLLFVLISFVIFDSPTLPDIVKRLLAMFGFSSIPLVSKEALYYLGSYAFVLILAIIGATPLPKMLYAKLSKNKAFAKITVIMEPVLLAVMLIVVTAFLVDGSFNPFLYFRF
ncbi:MAG: MBOAT family protein, partial [Clostridia bacterium]|nr:MBOAT family protein [Clostridia bacterium]